MLNHTQPDDNHITPEARRWLAAASLAVKASYRVDEVARLLCIGERAIYRMIERGDLDRLRLNRSGQHVTPTRIPISSLLSLLD